MEKQEHRKTAFKTLQQFLAWRVSKDKWKKITVYYGYFNPNFNRFRQVPKSNLSVRVTL